MKKHRYFAISLPSRIGEKGYLMSFVSFLLVDSVRSLGRKQSHVVPIRLSNKHRLFWVQSQAWASVTLLKIILKKVPLYETKDLFK